METIIRTANTDEQIALCWKAMHLLRPMLKEENFVAMVRLLQSEGYILNYIEDNGMAVAVAGYRFRHMLLCGKMLYIDDLSTLEESRGKGYASLLLRHIDATALSQNCKTVQLDSGAERTVAHKLYFKEGFTIGAFHFAKPVKP